MMKKIITIFVAFAICINSFSVSVFAQDTSLQYTQGQLEDIYENFKNNEYMLDSLFSDDSALAYWSMVNDMSENGVWNQSIDIASRILNEYPDKKNYAEILANLIIMQSGDIAEQIQTQSRFDDLKDGMDYTMDIVDIADAFVGGSGLLKSVSPIIDAATGGKDVIIESIEQAKYYETTIQDYSQAKEFLDAINKYAKNEELREVASSLSEANDILLQKRVEYLADTTETLIDYEATFFVKNLSFELLKKADIYRTDETVKWYVDCGTKLKDGILSVEAVGKFTFRMLMLAGDVGFGTTDTFKRYQEMRILADIAGAIAEANRQISVPQGADAASVLEDIQKKCNYYKMLIITHARGEYLVYQLLTNDAGILSNLQVIFDYFKEPEDTTESWYSAQVDCLIEYYNVLDRIFLVQSSENVEKVTSDERDIVLVLDVSGSMSGTPLDETKKAAVNFIETILKEDASIGIVTYDDEAYMSSDFSTDNATLQKIVYNLYDQGGTNIENALREASQMLKDSNAKKKIILLMSDGEPNEGKMGSDLVAYADTIKDEDILIYTIGFFENLGYSKASAQALMEGIASEGCHYEVEKANELVFFFEDMADQINGQKYIYVRIACPVDVSVTYKGETLDSSADNLNSRTDFGTLTFEENEEDPYNVSDDRVKVLRLKDGADYDLKLVGTGHGLMNYTIGFMNEEGDYDDFREFENIKITKKTVIDTVAGESKESVLNIDENGDGKYDLKLRAEQNGYGEEVKEEINIYAIFIGAGALILVVTIITIIGKIRKRRKVKVKY